MDNNPSLNSLLQEWTELVVALESCDMLDHMRMYDFNIDAHDAWVEFAYDQLDKVRMELKDRFDIELNHDCIGTTSIELVTKEDERKKRIELLK